MGRFLPGCGTKLRPHHLPAPKEPLLAWDDPGACKECMHANAVLGTWGCSSHVVRLVSTEGMHLTHRLPVVPQSPRLAGRVGSRRSGLALGRACYHTRTGCTCRQETCRRASLQDTSALEHAHNQCTARGTQYGGQGCRGWPHPIQIKPKQHRRTECTHALRLMQARNDGERLCPTRCRIRKTRC